MSAISAAPGPRPYESLLAKGEDRKQRILAAAENLLARNGWRNTSLAQIAKEAGVSAAGLLHHFESKEALLHAVLDARDFDDDTHADRGGDLIANIGRVAERFDRAPELVGTFTVLLVENIQPDAPLHDRLVARQQAAVGIVADAIRRGQDAGRYRTDLDPAAKAVEILAFVNGMETAWLLDPSIPLAAVFKGYTESLARDFAATSESEPAGRSAATGESEPAGRSAATGESEPAGRSAATGESETATAERSSI